MNPTFTEIQKFNKWWHYLLLLAPLTGILIMKFTILPEVENADKTTATNGFYTSSIAGVIVVFWILIIKLKTTINENGIMVNFYGIPFCKKEFIWSDITSIEVVEYSPIKEYGGWGVRMGPRGWCYNVSGKNGIKLIQTNGKPFLIGTQQKEEAEKIINLYFKK